MSLWALWLTSDCKHGGQFCSRHVVISRFALIYIIISASRQRPSWVEEGRLTLICNLMNDSNLLVLFVTRILNYIMNLVTNQSEPWYHIKFYQLCHCRPQHFNVNHNSIHTSFVWSVDSTRECNCCEQTCPTQLQTWKRVICFISSTLTQSRPQTTPIEGGKISGT